MTSILRTARVLAATVLLALPCLAAQAVEPLAPAEEAAVLSLARGTPTFGRYWLDEVVPMQTATETLRRAALLAHCAPLSSGAFSHLDATHRAAAQRVLAGQEALRREYLGPSDGPARHRVWLATFALSTDSGRAAVEGLARGPQSELLLRADSEDLVIDVFSEYSVDVVTGTGEPAAVIWLKGYFERAGRVPALRDAVRAAAPAQLADFDRVDGFERVGRADAPWLAALGGELARRQEALRAELLKAYPPAVLEARERLMAFRSEVQYFAPPGSAVAMLMPAADPLRDRAVAEAARTLHPLPEAAWEHVLLEGADMLPARAEVQRLCPPRAPAR